MATILLVKSIVLLPGEDEDDMAEIDLGVVTVTDEGLSWHLNKKPIYLATWEQWALQMTQLNTDVLFAR